jgi:ABC-2 type transport system ATP-binding protein
MVATVVEARHVEKSYGRHRVLTDVSFEAGRGELVGIVGENGAGKTTLLEVLVGLSKPTRGSVSIEGRLGYCPQRCLVFDLLTVDENLDYFSTAYGAGLGHARADAADHRRGLARWLRFEQNRGTCVSQLSAGTKQKINLAIALLHDPDVLILDEPYSGFDWETYLLFWEFVVEARSQGKTIIIVSHLMYDQSRFDQVLTLKDGVLSKREVQDCARPM